MPIIAINGLPSSAAAADTAAAAAAAVMPVMPSIPSMKLKTLVMPTIQRIVSGQAREPRLTLPSGPRATLSIGPSAATTPIAAVI